MATHLVEIAAAPAVEEVVVAAAADAVSLVRTPHDVGAPAGVDAEAGQQAADQLGGGEVERVRLPVTQQPHCGRGDHAVGVDLSGVVDDALDAAVGPEPVEADVHRPLADGDDLVDAIVAAVLDRVEALKGVGLSLDPLGGVAAHQVGVATAAAVERVIAAAAADAVGQGRADHRVAAPAAVDQEVAPDQFGGREVEDVRLPVADQPHLGAGGVEDALDPILRAEILQAHIHRTHAFGHDRVDVFAGGTGIHDAVEALEGVRPPLHPFRVEAAHSVGVAATGTVERVVTATAADVVGRGGAARDVAAVTGIDREIAAHQLHQGEVEDVALPVSQQPHRGAAVGGVDDALDAAVGPEAAEADVHRAEALGKDHVHALAAAVGVGVVTLEAVGLPVGVLGIGAAHQVGVAILAAIQGVVVEASVEQVGAAAAAQGVVAPAAVQQVGAACAVDHIVAPVSEHLIGFVVADERVGVPGADGEPPVEEEIVQPARDIAERLVGVAVLVEEVLALDLEAVVVNAVGHGVDQVLAEELGGGAVVLNQVEARLDAVLVVAVQQNEVVVAVGSHPAVDLPQVEAADPAVEVNAGFVDGLEEELVEAVGCGQAVVDVQRRRTA